MLVSCLTPTAGRREFWSRCVRCFLSQDYPELEWVIVDNGQPGQEILDLLPKDPRIIYCATIGGKLTHGQLMNLAMENSHGEIGAVWDDDDWYAPDRISKLVKPFTDPNVAIVGTGKIYYYLHGQERAFLYKNLTPQRWMAAPAFRRSVWEKIRFNNLPQGADTTFMHKIPPEYWVDLQDPTMIVSAIHAGNAAPKMHAVGSPAFMDLSWDKVEAITKGTL